MVVKTGIIHELKQLKTMMCLRPRPMYYIPGDPSTKYYVNCQSCVHCRINKRNEWRLRLEDEARIHPLTLFVTLTYEDCYVPYNDSYRATLYPEDMTLFLKRYRKKLDIKLNTKLRFYYCGEYGDVFQRPHYHALFYYNNNLDAEYLWKITQDSWQNGLIDIIPATSASITYCAKHQLKYEQEVGLKQYKMFPDVYRYPEFSRMSRRPGLGSWRRERLLGTDKLTLINNQGEKQAIPRYYKIDSHVESEGMTPEKLYILQDSFNRQLDNFRAKHNKPFFAFSPYEIYHEEQAIKQKYIDNKTSSSNYRYKEMKQFINYIKQFE